MTANNLNQKKPNRQGLHYTYVHKHTHTHKTPAHARMHLCMASYSSRCRGGRWGWRGGGGLLEVVLRGVTCTCLAQKSTLLGTVAGCVQWFEVRFPAMSRILEYWMLSSVSGRMFQFGDLGFDSVLAISNISELWIGLRCSVCSGL